MKYIANALLLVTFFFTVTSYSSKNKTQNSSTPIPSLADFIRSFPKLTERSPTVNQSAPTTSFVTLGGQQMVKNVVNCSQVMSFDQLAAFDPNNDVLWPGSIVQGKSLATGIMSPIAVARAPLSITVTNLMFTPTNSANPIYSANIQHPSLATIQPAMQRLISQRFRTNTPARISYSLKQYFSLDQALMQIGVDSKWLGGSVKAQLESGTSEEQSNYIVQFVQSYYSVSANPPATPSSFFATTVTPNNLRGYVASDSPPCYISTVTYGRTLYFFVSSSARAFELRAALEAGFHSGFNSTTINANAKLKQVIQESQIKALILGGSANSAVDLLVGDKIDGLRRYITEGADFSLGSAGVPISYQVRYLSDNSVARIAFSSDYQIPDFRNQRIKNIEVLFHLTSDDKDAPEEIQLIAYNNSIEVGKGNFGKGTKWKDPGDYACNFSLAGDATLNDQSNMKLHFYKTPEGSPTGNGMQGEMHVTFIMEDGNRVKWFDRGDTRWGDNNPYNVDYP